MRVGDVGWSAVGNVAHYKQNKVFVLAYGR